MLAREALQRSGLTRAQLARDADLSEAALWAWIKGLRAPKPESLRQLADGLEKRSGELRELAAELRKAAGE